MWDELGRRYGVRKVGSQRVSCGTGGFISFSNFLSILHFSVPFGGG